MACRRRPFSPRAAGIASACSLLALAGCGSGSQPAASTSAKQPSPINKVKTGGAPIGLLGYSGQLWVADAKRGSVVRIAPQSGRITARVQVGRTPLRVAAAGGNIWSTDFGSGTVSVVSPSSLRRVATIQVGPQPEGIVRFASDVWVVSQQGGYLARIAPGGSRPADRVT